MQLALSKSGQSEKPPTRSQTLNSKLHLSTADQKSLAAKLEKQYYENVEIQDVMALKILKNPKPVKRKVVEMQSRDDEDQSYSTHARSDAQAPNNPARPSKRQPYTEDEAAPYVMTEMVDEYGNPVYVKQTQELQDFHDNRTSRLRTIQENYGPNTYQVAEQSNQYVQPSQAQYSCDTLQNSAAQYRTYGPSSAFVNRDDPTNIVQTYDQLPRVSGMEH